MDGLLDFQTGDQVKVLVESSKPPVEGKFLGTLGYDRILVEVPHVVYSLGKLEPKILGKRLGEFKKFHDEWHLMCYRREP